MIIVIFYPEKDDFLRNFHSKNNTKLENSMSSYGCAIDFWSSPIRSLYIDSSEAGCPSLIVIYFVDLGQR